MARIALIGATGTLGKALIPKLLEKNYSVHCISRDEQKQASLRREYKEHNNVTFALADIRDFEATKQALYLSDYCILVAALKHVDLLETEVMEAVKTNIIGVNNVIQASIQNQIHSIAFATTDKAVNPINVYGQTKAIAEKLLMQQKEVRPTIFRWGNVIGSRGSVLDFFHQRLRDKKSIPLTDFRMTRFWIDIDDAAQFMADNFTQYGACHVPKMKASKVRDLALSLADVTGLEVPEFEIVGLRPGEKIHESIYADNETEITSDNSEQYTIEELRDLIRRHLERKCEK